MFGKLKENLEHNSDHQLIDVHQQVTQLVFPLLPKLKRYILQKGSSRLVPHAIHINLELLLNDHKGGLITDMQFAIKCGRALIVK